MSDDDDIIQFTALAPDGKPLWHGMCRRGSMAEQAPGYRVVEGLVEPDQSDRLRAQLAFDEMRRNEMQIGMSQFLLALAAAGIMTPDEAVLAATVGAMPPAIEAAVAGLTPLERVAAQVTWARSPIIRRADPLFDAIAAGNRMTPAAMDAMFGVA